MPSAYALNIVYSVLFYTSNYDKWYSLLYLRFVAPSRISLFIGTFYPLILFFLLSISRVIPLLTIYEMLAEIVCLQRLYSPIHTVLIIENMHELMECYAILFLFLFCPLYITVHSQTWCVKFDVREFRE